MSRKKKIIIAVLVVVVLGGVAAANLSMKRSTAITVNVEKIEKRDLESIVSASGKVQPKRKVSISAETSGKVVNLQVNEGDMVTKGQLLLQIDPRNLETVVLNREASLNTQRSQLDQMKAILLLEMTKKKVDVRCLDYGDVQKISGNKVKQEVKVRVGVDQELAKKIVKLLKDSKMKVQAAIQGDAVRVSGAKRDVLQEAIALVKKEIADFPLQYGNFRD